jgi:hypothetical protein
MIGPLRYTAKDLVFPFAYSAINRPVVQAPCDERAAQAPRVGYGERSRVR